METKVAEKPAYVSREEKNGITQEFIKELFEYKDGWLYRIKRTSNKSQIGERVACLDICGDGYERYRTEINHHSYNISRLIFIYHYGYVPEFIDHVDRNPANNKIENLRESTRSENNKNRRSAKGSSSQYLGVSLHRSKQKNKNGETGSYIFECWIVRIKTDEKCVFGGCFPLDKEIEAALHYNKLAIKYHKEFANLNIIKPK